MSTLNTGAFAKFLWPGINAIYGKAYNDYPVQYTALFDSYKSGKNFEEDVGMTSFGLASVKPEGDSITYDTEKMGYITRYTHSVLANGFIVTREMYEDDLYGAVGGKRAQGLARSMRQTKDTIGANVYNRAFTSTYAGGDGKELCATDHPNITGGTWSNELTTPADLSEAALEQACIDIGKWTDDSGMKIAARPKTLIIPIDLSYEAERILKSPYRVGTSDNDINALNSMGKFQSWVINHYLTDVDAWFIRTDVMHGMKHFQRRALSFAIDNEFDTENAKFKAIERYSFGWTDPRGVYGSPGA